MRYVAGKRLPRKGMSPNQKWAKERNFNLFKLMGMVALLQSMHNNNSILPCEQDNLLQCISLLKDTIHNMKRSKDESLQQFLNCK